MADGPGSSFEEAAAALRATRERLELAERATGIGVFDWDLARDRLTWSPAVYALHRVPREQTPSYDVWLAAVHPDDRAAILATRGALLAAAQGGSNVMPDAFTETEYRVLLHDGAVRWIAARACVVVGSDSRPTRLLGVNFDVTRRKQAEVALRRSEERFRLATEALAGFVYDWDPATGRVERYGRMQEIIGFDPGEASADVAWWTARVHPDDLPGVQAHAHALLEDGAAGYDVEYRVRHRDGHYVDVADRARVVRDGGGRVTRIVGGTNDVSERRRYERQHAAMLERERDARERADEANRAKGELLATMSHELRTPLNAILGYAQLMEMGLHGPVTQQQRDVLARVAAAQHHLLALINDILQFAKLEAGQLHLTLADVPLTDLCERVESVVGPSLTARHLTYSCDARDSAAPSGPPLVVHADAGRVVQILVNLVTNAIKYTPDGGSVSVTAASDADCVLVMVGDTGRGIDPAQLEAIFRPFVQVQQGRPSREGVGLGLAISRELARAMGGDVVAESVLGAGSTFTLILPRAKRAPRAEER
jgi:PAS domain S-box-containing protein